MSCTSPSSTSALCSLAYVVAYSAIEGRSPSMALLVYVADARGQGRTRDELEGLLRGENPVSARLQAMLLDKMVVENGGCIMLTAKRLGVGSKPRCVPPQKFLGMEKGRLAPHVFAYLCAPRNQPGARASPSTVVSHVVASRSFAARGHYLPLMAGCACGLAATSILSAVALVLMHDGVLDFLSLLSMNIVAYMAFSFGYFNFINLNIASLRIRMPQELAESGGTMPVDSLTSLYNTEDVISCGSIAWSAAAIWSSGKGVIIPVTGGSSSSGGYSIFCVG